MACLKGRVLEGRRDGRRGVMASHLAAYLTAGLLIMVLLPLSEAQCVSGYSSSVATHLVQVTVWKCLSSSTKNLTSVTSQNKKLYWDYSNQGLTAINSGAFPKDVFSDIDLASNSIVSLPRGLFDNLTSLNYLNLSYNQISSLEGQLLKRMTNLLSLDISHNHIASASTSSLVQDSEYIKTFFLNDNRLSSLPGRVPDDATLDFRRNNFTSFRFGQKVRRTQGMLLDGNPINLTSISQWFKFPDALTGRLSLQNCLLKDISATNFPNGNSIASLDLSYNQITFLAQGVFQNLTSVTSLSLRANNLLYLEENLFKTMTKLQSLDVRDNNVVLVHPLTFQAQISIQEGPFMLNLDSPRPFICSIANFTHTGRNVTIVAGERKVYADNGATNDLYHVQCPNGGKWACHNTPGQVEVTCNVPDIVCEGNIVKETETVVSHYGVHSHTVSYIRAFNDYSKIFESADNAVTYCSQLGGDVMHFRINGSCLNTLEYVKPYINLASNRAGGLNILFASRNDGSGALERSNGKFIVCQRPVHRCLSYPTLVVPRNSKIFQTYNFTEAQELCLGHNYYLPFYPSGSTKIQDTPGFRCFQDLHVRMRALFPDKLTNMPVWFQGIGTRGHRHVVCLSRYTNEINGEAADIPEQDFSVPEGYTPQYSTSKQDYKVTCPQDCGINGQCSYDLFAGVHKCQCSVGYYGNSCQHQDCKCGKGGYCVKNQTNHYCLCHPGFTGENCNEVYNPCAENPCSQYGRCSIQTSTNPQHKCECDSGYTGPRCEEPTCPAFFRTAGNTVENAWSHKTNIIETFPPSVQLLVFHCIKSQAFVFVSMTSDGQENLLNGMTTVEAKQLYQNLTRAGHNIQSFKPAVVATFLTRFDDTTAKAILEALDVQQVKNVLSHLTPLQQIDTHDKLSQDVFNAITQKLAGSPFPIITSLDNITSQVFLNLSSSDQVKTLDRFSSQQVYTMFSELSQLGHTVSSFPGAVNVKFLSKLNETTGLKVLGTFNQTELKQEFNKLSPDQISEAAQALPSAVFIEVQSRLGQPIFANIPYSAQLNVLERMNSTWADLLFSQLTSHRLTMANFKPNVNVKFLTKLSKVQALQTVNTLRTSQMQQIFFQLTFEEVQEAAHALNDDVLQSVENKLGLSIPLVVLPPPLDVSNLLKLPAAFLGKLLNNESNDVLALNLRLVSGGDLQKVVDRIPRFYLGELLRKLPKQQLVTILNKIPAADRLNLILRIENVGQFWNEDLENFPTVKNLIITMIPWNQLQVAASFFF